MSDFYNNIKFFISSTFIDMHEERDALQLRILPAIRKFTENLGLYFDFCDLRWGINTENAENSENTRKILRTCFSEIRNCKPYMIVLLGERYGSTIHQCDIATALELLNDGTQNNFTADDISERSYTELEILYGPMTDDEQFRRTLFLFRNPIEGGPGKFHGLDGDRLKAQQLKERIRLRAHKLNIDNCIEYSLGWDDASGKLTGMDDFCSLLIGKLLELIEPVIENIKSLSYFERLYNKNLAIVRQQSSKCTGLSDMVAECKSKLRPGDKTLVIYDSGNISSHVACKIVEEKINDGWNVCPFIADTNGFYEEDEHYALWAKYIDTLIHAQPTVEYSPGGKLHSVNGGNFSAAELFFALADEYSNADNLPPLLLYYNYLISIHDITIKFHSRYKVPLFYKNIAFMCSDRYNSHQSLYDSEGVFLDDNSTDIIKYVDAELSAMGKELSHETYELLTDKVKYTSIEYAQMLLQRFRMLDRSDFARGTNAQAQNEMFSEIIKNAPNCKEMLGAAIINAAAERIDHDFCNATAFYIALSINGLTRNELIDLFTTDNIGWRNDYFYAFLNAAGETVQEKPDGRLVIADKKTASALLAKKNTIKYQTNLYNYIKTKPAEDKYKRENIAELCCRADDREYLVHLLQEEYTDDPIFIKRMQTLKYSVDDWIIDVIKNGEKYGGDERLLFVALEKIWFASHSIDLNRVKAAEMLYDTLKDTLPPLNKARALYLFADMAANDNGHGMHTQQFLYEYFSRALNHTNRVIDILEEYCPDEFDCLAKAYVRRVILMRKLGQISQAWSMLPPAIKYIKAHSAHITPNDLAVIYIQLYWFLKIFKDYDGNEYDELFDSITEQAFKYLCICGKNIDTVELSRIEIIPATIIERHVDNWFKSTLPAEKRLENILRDIVLIGNIRDILPRIILARIYVDYCRCLISIGEAEQYRSSIKSYADKSIAVLDESYKYERRDSQKNRTLAYYYFLCAKVLVSIGEYHSADSTFVKAENCISTAPEIYHGEHSELCTDIYCGHTDLLIKLNKKQTAIKTLSVAAANLIGFYEYATEQNVDGLSKVMELCLKTFKMNEAAPSEILEFVNIILLAARFISIRNIFDYDPRRVLNVLHEAIRACEKNNFPCFELELRFKELEYCRQHSNFRLDISLGFSAYSDAKREHKNDILLCMGGIAETLIRYDMSYPYGSIKQFESIATSALLHSPHFRIRYAALCIYEYLSRKNSGTKSRRYLRALLNQTNIYQTKQGNRIFISAAYTFNISKYAAYSPIQFNQLFSEPYEDTQTRINCIKKLYCGTMNDLYGKYELAEKQLSACAELSEKLYKNTQTEADTVLYIRCCTAYAQLLEKLNNPSAFKYYTEARELLIKYCRGKNNLGDRRTVADDVLVLKLNMAQSPYASFRYTNEDRLSDIRTAKELANDLYHETKLRKYAALLKVAESLTPPTKT